MAPAKPRPPRPVLAHSRPLFDAEARERQRKRRERQKRSDCCVAGYPHGFLCASASNQAVSTFSANLCALRLCVKFFSLLACTERLKSLLRVPLTR